MGCGEISPGGLPSAWRLRVARIHLCCASLVLFHTAIGSRRLVLAVNFLSSYADAGGERIVYPPRIWIEYRPVRIGWVLADPDTALFAEAVRLTHCLWGGTYNPIIPAYRPELARSLCKVFNVDLLFGIGPEDKTKPLIDEFPYLPPGMWGRTIFQDNCRFVDVYHPMRKLSERIAWSCPPEWCRSCG